MLNTGRPVCSVWAVWPVLRPRGFQKITSKNIFCSYPLIPIMSIYFWTPLAHDTRARAVRGHVVVKRSSEQSPQPGLCTVGSPGPPPHPPCETPGQYNHLLYKQYRGRRTHALLLVQRFARSNNIQLFNLSNTTLVSPRILYGALNLEVWSSAGPSTTSRRVGEGRIFLLVVFFSGTETHAG